MTSEKLTHKQFVKNVVRLMDHYVDGQEKQVVKHMKLLLKLYDDVDYRSKCMKAKWSPKSTQRHLLFGEFDNTDMEGGDFRYDISESMKQFNPNSEIKKLKGSPGDVWQEVFEGVLYMLESGESQDYFYHDRVLSDLPKLVDFLELLAKKSPVPFNVPWEMEEKFSTDGLWDPYYKKAERHKLKEDQKFIKKQEDRVEEIWRWVEKNYLSFYLKQKK